jgi:hypothetical protein
VDVGGASGHASIWLARVSTRYITCPLSCVLERLTTVQIYSHLHFIVQDGSEDLLAQGNARDLSDLNGRVTFMEHDFFDPQPELNAGAYFIRQVVHNWNDADCVRILRNIVPAIEKCAPNTPLLINEMILPEPGTRSRYEEHLLRQVDMLVMVSLGAKQRTLKEFQRLIHEADPRLQIVRVYGNGSMGLIEVHLVEINGQVGPVN